MTEIRAVDLNVVCLWLLSAKEKQNSVKDIKCDLPNRLIHPYVLYLVRGSRPPPTFADFADRLNSRKEEEWVET